MQFSEVVEWWSNFAPYLRNVNSSGSDICADQQLTFSASEAIKAVRTFLTVKITVIALHLTTALSQGIVHCPDYVKFTVKGQRIP